MSTIIQTKPELDNITAGFGVASVIVIILNTILTIAKEMYPPLLAFMKNISIFGIKHHWLVHGLVILILFLLLGWYFSKKETIKKISGASLSKALIWTTIISSLGIVVFFLIEIFK